jgi:chromosomal replication initiation ATPase DnaA
LGNLGARWGKLRIQVNQAYPRRSLIAYGSPLQWAGTAVFFLLKYGAQVRADIEGAAAMIEFREDTTPMIQTSDPRSFHDGDTGAASGPVANVDPQHILRTSIEQMVAAAFRLDEELLRLPTRGRKNVALARQTAMYLAHTVCGLTLTETGDLFQRDRTTVAHACQVIEDRREDPTFDRAIDMLERSARIVQFHAAGTVGARS